MATRHYTEITTGPGDRFRMEIDDTQFIGTATELVSGAADGFVLSYPKLQMKLPGIQPSEFRYSVAIRDSLEATFINLVASSKEGRFRLKVYIWDGAAWALWWAGVVIPDNAAYEDLDYTFAFEISAIDGLSYLQKIDYNDGTDAYTGTERLAVIVGNILKKLDHVTDIWTGSDDFIRTIIDYYENNHTYAAANCPLYYTLVNQRAWFTLDNAGNEKWISCWNVLENIVRMFNCRMMLHNGFWLIEQIDIRSDISFYSRQYNFAIDAPTAAPDMYGKVNIDPQDDNPRLYGGKYSWIPSLRSVKISYNAQNRRNYIAGFSWTNASGSLQSLGNVDNVSGAAALRLTGGFAGGFQNVSATEGEYRYPIWSITIKVGTKYLKRDVDYVNGQIYASATTWETSVSAYQYTTGLFQVPSVGSFANVSGSIDIVTPLLPESGDGQMNISAVTISGGGGSWTSYWSFSSGYLELLVDGNSIAATNDVEYEQFQADGEGTEDYQFNTQIADGTSSASAGGLIVGLTNSNLWGLGGGPYDTPLVELLALQLLKSMQYPRRRMTHDVFGPYFPIYYILDDGADEWVFLGGTFTATPSTWSGEWVKLEAGTATYDPVKIKLGNNHVPINVPGGDPNPGGLGGSGLQNLAPATLEPVTAAKVSGTLSPGAISSITVSEALSARSFRQDQVLSLVNPATGATDSVTVTADVADGDTSISVSGTISNLYGSGSFVVVRLDTYFKQGGLAPFSLPTGTIGQILRHDGDAWDAYSGVTDGHVLTWDTTNGWQAEALPAGSTNYQTFKDDGVAATQRPNANFVSTARVALTLTDDAVNTETEISADIVTNSIGNTHIRQGVARSVIGVTGNATADVADIQGTTDQVLRVNSAGTALAFGQVATGGITDLAVTTAKIADDAVTYAKLQNIAANNTVLGRVSGAGGNAEELTVAQLYTLLGLAGTANRFALWTGANALGSNAAYTFDSVNGRMTVTGIGTGTGANTGFINLNSGALGAATTFLRASGNVSSNMIGELVNANNSTVNANTLFTLAVGGASAGDPALQFTVTGAVTHSIGIDNSDSDKLKITPTSATPGGVVNCGIVITNSATPNIGINKDAPIHPLDVGGIARAEQYRGTGNLWSNSNIAFGTGAGTGPTPNSISGTANAMQFNFTTGTSPTANGIIFTATYPTAFGTITYVTLAGRGDPGGINYLNNESKFNIDSAGATTFVLKANGTLPASTQFAIQFIIMGY